MKSPWVHISRQLLHNSNRCCLKEELLHYVLLTRLKTDGSMKDTLTSPDEVRSFLWNAKADKPRHIWWEKTVHLWAGRPMCLSPTVTVTGSPFSFTSLVLPIALSVSFHAHFSESTHTAPSSKAVWKQASSVMVCDPAFHILKQICREKQICRPPRAVVGVLFSHL